MEWILLFGLPLVITPSGWTEVPKVVVAEGLILGLWLVKIWRHGFISWNKISPFLVLAGYVVIRGGEWGGNGFRLQGVILTLFVVSVGAWAACKQNLSIPRGVVWVGMGMLLLSLFFVEANAATRAIGTLGEPNALASVFVFSWPFVGGYGWPAAALVVALSRSRSAIVAMGIQSVMWIIARTLNRDLRVASVLAGVLLMGSLMMPFFEKNNSWESRSTIWKTAVSAGFRKPVFGWGFGKVEEALKSEAVRLNTVTRFVRVDSAHNLFLDWWIQGGALGLGLWLWVVGKGLMGLVKKDRKTETIALVGLLVTMSFNPSSVVTLVQFWWLVGVGMV